MSISTGGARAAELSIPESRVTPQLEDLYEVERIARMDMNDGPKKGKKAEVLRAAWEAADAAYYACLTQGLSVSRG